MTTPARTTQGLLDHQEALEDAIARTEEEASGRTLEILNHSQAKLKDLEDETRVLQAEKGKIDTLIQRGKDSLRQLEHIIATDETNSEDLGKAIRANLSSIDSLRKDGVIIPQQQ